MVPYKTNRSIGSCTARALYCIFVCWIGSLFGCTISAPTITSETTNSANKKLKVVVTTGMIADLVRTIGGDTIEVNQLMNSGVDPHLYRPTRDDVRAILGADIVFYNGLKLEGRMSDLLSKQPAAPKKHVAVGESLSNDEILGDPEHEAADPHVWMDVSMWSKVTVSIESTLSERLKEHADDYAKRAKEIRQQLDQLDGLGKNWIATIPDEKRILITSHDAFRYFGRRYGIRVEGVQGVSTSSEAGLKRIRELVDLLHENKIPAAFVESSVAGGSIASLIEGAAARGTEVKIGGELYSDAMGPDGSGAETYLGMMKHNFKTIVEALGGTAN